MFLIDKYKNDMIMPSYDLMMNLLDSLDIHTNIYRNISNVVKESPSEFKKIINSIEHGEWRYANLPHMIIYGPDGCGKEFILETLLQKIFTKKSVELQEIEYTINGYSNTKTKVLIKQSKHHIMIEPNNNGFDKYLIQEIIEEYAQSEILNILKYKQLYKIVVINLIDNLSYYAQASLRRTMEKYAHNCKFIFISNQLSRIHEPLKSRCLMVRIPKPSIIKQVSIILDIAMRENIKLYNQDVIEIINKSNNNINKIFGFLELKKYNAPIGDDWTNIISLLIDNIIDKKNYNTKNFQELITNIRNTIYPLYITNIDFHIIIRQIMITFKTKIKDNKLLFQIIEETSKFENRISQGTRHIIHLEAYLLKVIQILNI